MALSGYQRAHRTAYNLLTNETHSSTPPWEFEFFLWNFSQHPRTTSTMGKTTVLRAFDTFTSHTANITDRGYATDLRGTLTQPDILYLLTRTFRCIRAPPVGWNKTLPPNFHLNETDVQLYYIGMLGYTGEFNQIYCWIAHHFRFIVNAVHTSCHIGRQQIHHQALTFAHKPDKKAYENDAEYTRLAQERQREFLGGGSGSSSVLQTIIDRSSVPIGTMPRYRT